MAQIALIGAASGWGAGFRHAEEGPLALREHGLERWLEERGVDAEWRAMLHAEKSWRDHPEITGAAADGQFPVVLGGDHSIAMGTWTGVARAQAHRPLGLVWLDAHLDAHTVETTPSMNAHGMGVAALLGRGHAPFVALAGGVLKPQHLCYIGARSYEAGEMALLRRLGVRIITMDEVKRRGVDWALREAASIALSGTA